MPREKPQFAQGTKVGVRFGGRVMPATVIEDRGVFQDVRIVRVLLESANFEPLKFEISTDELEPLPRLRRARPPEAAVRAKPPSRGTSRWRSTRHASSPKSRPNPCVRSPAMASKALMTWREDSAGKLDELIAAHASVGGTGRGRRYATQQINASLVVQIAGHFQLFCRDLHTEAAYAIIAAAPVSYRSMLQVAFTERRGLDRGNASAWTIASDFERFDLDLWAGVATVSAMAATQRRRLEQLTIWRNAIAHQDFSFGPKRAELLADTAVTLAWVRRWRVACDGLARSFDKVVASHVAAVTGDRPGEV